MSVSTARPPAPRGAAAGVAARRAALEILLRVNRESAYADLLLGRRLPEFDESDRRLITRLVLGTLAWRGRLDDEIGRLASRPVEKIGPAVLEILRMALFQMRFLTRVPEYAAVDTAVGLARANPETRDAAGFINAVLRRAAREPGAAMVACSDDAEGRLAVQWSHPRWLAKKFIQWFGAEGAESLMAADNEAAPTAIRLNLARGARDDLIARIEADGMRVAGPGRFPETLLLSGAPGIGSESFRAGLFHAQSEASQMVARLLAPARDAVVADCAAAPGGKTTHLAELVGERGRVIALDRSLRGLGNARAVARRLGHRNIDFVCADLESGPPFSASSFEFVLLDAPCTGTGTLREHPEIRWRLGPGDFARMAAVQLAMLENAAAMVRPRGALVYSVCSLAPDEGADVVAGFLAGHPEFTLDRDSPVSQALGGVLREDGAMLTRPDRDGLDGFFAARIVRR